ncbi:zinc finger CCCH domain-containing protein 32-like [Phoenix dactylifera]|uniref:Zinc finger CCCH domain-containing protein 32-like n=1 Tax=Phoenix dactylifera TaxID=42345 RepID=A0A8B8ZW15_PHODC|nr:zinc finger CCCH domain-containing protein 32-like [Phoenix dactylifera]
MFPCYYFQKGHCLRGDKCPFMHGPQQTGNPVPQQVVKVSTPPPDPVSTIKKIHGVSRNVLLSKAWMKQSLTSYKLHCLMHPKMSFLASSKAMFLSMVALLLASPDVIVSTIMWKRSDYFHDEGGFRRAPVQGGRNLNHVSSEQQRISCERILDRASMPEKRMLQREKSYHDIDGSDLRHRLLKRRRPDGSRSALSPDRCGKLDQRDNHARHAHRGDRRIHMESSISSRLQGRITLPARSLPDRPTDLALLVQKSLAELKGAKLSENFQDQKNIKLGKTFGDQESEGSSFEGPKPLSIILKRKREPASGNGAISSNGDNNNQRDIEGGIGSSVTAATEKEGDYAADCLQNPRLLELMKRKKRELSL